MCDFVTYQGAKLRSIADLAAAGLEVLPDRTFADWDPKACLCGVDIEGVLEDNQLTFVPHDDGDFEVTAEADQ